MEVLDIKELPNGRSMSVDEKGQRSYTRVFRAVTDHQKVGPGVVRAALEIAIRDHYETETEYDELSFCNAIDVVPESNSDRKGWTLTVKYGPLSGQDQQNEDGNPLNQPVQRQWGFAQFQRTTDRTRDGEPIVNTAGDPYLNQENKDDSRPVLSITRNEAFFNAALAYSYRDTVNSDTFQGAGPGQVKVSNISASQQYDPNFGFYWQVSYEYMFSAEGFKLKLTSMGLNEKNDDGERVPILVKGKAITEPVLLDKKGKKVPPGGEPYVQEFDLYNETAFSVFNL